MTYAIGGLIQASDYNGFVSTSVPNLNNIWSTGAGSSGYGQTALTTVSVGDNISATEWSSLVNRIASAAAHQGTAITAITPPVVGDIISFYSSLATNINTINTNRLNAAATGTDITNTGTRTTNWGGAVGIPTVTSTVTLTFASANEARYFFNAGGTLRLSCSRSGGSSTAQDVAFTTLCTNIGTLGLPADSSVQSIAGTSYQGFTKIGGGGLAPNIYIRNGYYQLTAISQSLFRQLTNSGVYTSDNVTVTGRTTGAAVIMTVAFNDFTSGGSTDLVTGSLSVTATARPPSISNITNSWGTPTLTVTSPS